MKKGLIILTAVAMLFGIVSCAGDPVVGVSKLTLNKTTWDVSPDSPAGTYDLNVVDVQPANAADKKVTFTLLDPTSEVEVGTKSGTTKYTTDEVVSVSKEDGVLTFLLSEEKRNDVHTTFTVRATAASGAYADCTFYYNYDAPTAIKNTLVGGVADVAGTTVDLTNISGYETMEIVYNFDDVEFPVIQYVDKNDALLPVDATKGVVLFKNEKNVVIAELDPKTNVLTAKESGMVEFSVKSAAVGSTAEKDFTVYINRIKNAAELKYFLVDASVSTSFPTTLTRAEQLVKATEGCLAQDLTAANAIAPIVSKSSISKTLDLNKKTVSFTGTGATTALDISTMADGTALTVKNGTINLKEPGYDATLINAGTKGLNLDTVTATVEGKNVIGITSNAGYDNRAFFKAVKLTATGSNSAVGVKADYFVIEADSTEASKSSINVNGTEEAKGLDIEVKAILTSARVSAKGKNAIAVDATTFVDIYGADSTYEATGNNDTGKAIALLADNSHVFVSDATLTATAKEAVAVSLKNIPAYDGTEDEVSIEKSTLKATGAKAFGLYDKSTQVTALKDVTINVIGKKSENVIFDIDAEYPNAVAGIVTTATTKISQNLTITVDNDGNNKMLCDVYGIYNKGVMSYFEEMDYWTSKMIPNTVSVKVTVDKGGAVALKNLGTVNINSSTASFIAERETTYDEVNDEAVIYGVDSTLNGVAITNSTVTFQAKTSGNNTDIANNLNTPVVTGSVAVTPAVEGTIGYVYTAPQAN